MKKQTQKDIDRYFEKIDKHINEEYEKNYSDTLSSFYFGKRSIKEINWVFVFSVFILIGILLKVKNPLYFIFIAILMTIYHIYLFINYGLKN